MPDPAPAPAPPQPSAEPAPLSNAEPAPAAQPQSQWKFGVTYIPFVLDLALRYVWLIAWRFQRLPAGLFWTAQVATGFLMFYFLNKRDGRIQKQTGVANALVHPEGNPRDGVILLLLIAHAGYQTFGVINASGGSNKVLTGAFLTALAAVYIFFLYLFSSVPIQPSPDAPEPIYDAVDENDRVLIKLQTHISSLERRVESYTVESTLIGALAFSAFVTIVASDKATVEAVGEFLKDTSQVIGYSVGLRGWDALNLLRKLAVEKTVLAAIASQTLVCSMCFLAVIIARLRFNSLVAPANYSIQMAAAFNKKEDDLQHHVLTTGNTTTTINARLALLEVSVADSLKEATEEFQKLQPIVMYMGAFRSLGVGMFLLALVTSASWVSPLLAVGFAGISVVTYSYPTIDRWLRDAPLRKHAFFRLPVFLRQKIKHH